MDERIRSFHLRENRERGGGEKNILRSSHPLIFVMERRKRKRRLDRSGIHTKGKFYANELRIRQKVVEKSLVRK